MAGPSELHARQVWAVPTPTNDPPRSCRPIQLSSGGVVSVDGGALITLAGEAFFQPACTNRPEPNASSTDYNVSVLGAQPPFYASASPQAYALSACTVISYMLLIILFITPRTFFVGGAGGGSGFLARRGMINGASGSTSIIGVGGRPWLQKVAALTVTISLTIATADTFKVSEQQYDHGYQDAVALTNKVLDGVELRVARLISSTCLWLALAQTLIRLFQRHREKVTIKWVGFFLIVLDTLFSALNSFVPKSPQIRPRRLAGAIPALNYLFTFVLEIVYMLMVLQYALSKRRFAFYHPKMRNMSLMALLSVTAVLIPVVFFTLDILKPNVLGWGNYVRWVGAAAASVLVWEWVERIEALERDENKDGILGREIYDGDEMLEDTRSSVVSWPSSRNDPRGSAAPDTRVMVHHANPGGRNSRHDGSFTVSRRLVYFRNTPFITYVKRRRKPRSTEDVEKLGGSDTPQRISTLTSSPLSRNPVGSHMNKVTADEDSASPVPPHATLDTEKTLGKSSHASQPTKTGYSPQIGDRSEHVALTSVSTPLRWLKSITLFSRSRKEPPAEVLQIYPNTSSPHSQSVRQAQNTDSSRSEFMSKIRMDRKQKSSKAKATPMPEIVIPWQPRGQELLRRLEGQEESEGDEGAASGTVSACNQVEPTEQHRHLEAWQQQQQQHHNHPQLPEVVSRAQTMSPRRQGTQSAIGPEHSVSLQGTPAPRDDG